MDKPKYANYAELAAAFKSGELDPNNYFIMLDKGGADATLCYRGAEMDDCERDRMNEAAKELFDPEYYDHIYDLYAALGIPVEAC